MGIRGGDLGYFYDRPGPLLYHVFRGIGYFPNLFIVFVYCVTISLGNRLEDERKDASLVLYELLCY